MMFAFACFALLCATIPTAMYLANRRLFLIDEYGDLESARSVPVSVLIPARNEVARIGMAIESLLNSEHANFEIVVLDDHSEDGTAELILQFASRDSRVRLVSGNTLPADWNGKQYACYQLVNAALNEHVLFLDADVQLQPSALACLLALKQRSQVALLSAFPKQLMGSPLELAVVPLMHYILLGFLPFNRMRRSTHPAYAAGCGQLFLTTKTEYQAAGTHAAIRGSRHDGIKLPKAYRAAGLSTDVVDGTRLAACRMYSGAAEVVRGVLKNADEGIANPRAIMPFSVLLLGSTLLPLLLLIGAVIGHHFIIAAIACVALVTVHVPRFMAIRDLQQPVTSALLHVPAITAFVFLQWIALAMSLLGRKVTWKNRM